MNTLLPTQLTGSTPTVTTPTSQSSRLHTYLSHERRGNEGRKVACQSGGGTNPHIARHRRCGSECIRVLIPWDSGRGLCVLLLDSASSTGSLDRRKEERRKMPSQVDAFPNSHTSTIPCGPPLACRSVSPPVSCLQTRMAVGPGGPWGWREQHQQQGYHRLYAVAVLASSAAPPASSAPADDAQSLQDSRCQHLLNTFSRSQNIMHPA